MAGSAMLSDEFAIITVARLVQSTARIDQRRGWPISSSVGTASPSCGDEQNRYASVAIHDLSAPTLA